jgi:GntR family transcriptional regulator, carbon starvation induced regulator
MDYLREEAFGASFVRSEPNAGAIATLESAVRRKLRYEIITGALKPSHKLRVTDLSSRYEAAGTTVREALSRLVSEGLVTREENRGFRVAPASLEDLSELTSTRKIIEREAFRLSMQRGDASWEAEIVGHFHRLSLVTLGHGNFLEWEVPHRAFHHALLSACGNSLLLSLADHLYDLGQRYRAIMVGFDPKGGRDLISEHRALMEAALARNAEKGANLLSRHLDFTFQVIKAAWGQRLEAKHRASRSRTANAGRGRGR